MVRRMQVVLEDDIDGGEADRTVSFAWEGVEYEIDLNSKNSQAMADAIAPYVNAARRVGGRRRRAASGASATSRAKLSEVRAWARENGYTVSDRGRVPAEIKEAWEKANA